MSNKSEAQLKNEAEVKRILAERGYSSKASKKKVSKSFGSNISPAPFIYGLLGIAIIAGGIWFFQNNPFQESSETSGSTSITSSYENTYDLPPQTTNDSLSITEFDDSVYQQRVDENEQEYLARMAEIDAELAKNLAEIKARGEAWDEELARRVKERELEAEKQRAEHQQQIEAYERQTAAYEAEKQSQAQSAKAKCDEYLAKYGEQTAEEIAESDPEVKSAKNTLNEKSKAYNSAYNSLNNNKSDAVLTEDQRVPLREKYNSAKSEMDAAESAYKRILSQKTSYYRTLKANSCKE